MGTRILAVEDDERIRAAVKLALEDEGWTVDEAASGEEAAILFLRQPADVVLIDIMLPGIDGFELCRTIRRSSDVPIVMVTARADTHDVVAGLEAGADDYLTKDISRSHLLARINGLLRRVVALRNPENQEQVLKRGDLELNSERLTTTWGESQIALTYTEFWMLYVMAKNPGHIKSREQLMEAARVVLDDSTVTSHIRRIRRKFEAADKQFKHLETAYGLGYRWRGDA